MVGDVALLRRRGLDNADQDIGSKLQIKYSIVCDITLNFLYIIK